MGASRYVPLAWTRPVETRSPAKRRSIASEASEAGSSWPRFRREPVREFRLEMGRGSRFFEEPVTCWGESTDRRSSSAEQYPTLPLFTPPRAKRPWKQEHRDGQPDAEEV